MRPADTKRAGYKAALPIVLLPGTLCDARVFAPLQERLASVSTHVIMTGSALTLAEAAEQVLAQAPHRFALLGFSLGGMIAMEAVLKAPERICGVALLSTTALPVAHERHADRRAAVEEARSGSMSRFLRERLWPYYSGPHADSTTLPLLEAMAESLGHGAFKTQTEMALCRSDYSARLLAVRCPSLILAGEQDRLCPPEAQRHLAAAIVGSVCKLLPGAGHFALLEQPDEVAASVAAWFHTVQAAQRPSGSETGETRPMESE